MMDDVDRDCCATVEHILRHGLDNYTVTRITENPRHPGSGQISAGQPHGWRIVEREFHDPGMTLVLEHERSFGIGHPQVTVAISYGGAPGKQ